MDSKEGRFANRPYHRRHLRGGTCGYDIRVLAVQFSFQGIVLDVFTHAAQFDVIPDDVFVIIALP
jgi:ssDNA-binding replication factor A large subunit